MALKFNKGNKIKSRPKKTRQGRSTNTKYGQKGGGSGGSKTSKTYIKKYRGQG